MKNYTSLLISRRIMALRDGRVPQPTHFFHIPAHEVSPEWWEETRGREVWGHLVYNGSPLSGVCQQRCQLMENTLGINKRRDHLKHPPRVLSKLMMLVHSSTKGNHLVLQKSRIWYSGGLITTYLKNSMQIFRN